MELLIHMMFNPDNRISPSVPRARKMADMHVFQNDVFIEIQGKNMYVLVCSCVCEAHKRIKDITKWTVDKIAKN